MFLFMKKNIKYFHKYPTANSPTVSNEFTLDEKV